MKHSRRRLSLSPVVSTFSEFLWKFKLKREETMPSQSPVILFSPIRRFPSHSDLSEHPCFPAQTCTHEPGLPAHSYHTAVSGECTTWTWTWLFGSPVFLFVQEERIQRPLKGKGKIYEAFFFFGAISIKSAISFLIQIPWLENYI